MINEIASVISNYEIASNYWQAILKAPEISRQAKPGQFVNILPIKNWPKMMRRPMSIASNEHDNISIIYKVVGEGTQYISDWKEGSKVDIIGPLGNTWPDFKDEYPLLIGGGVGIAPILYLQDKFSNDGISHNLIMGARTGSEHFLDHSPDEGIILTTDDGTIGIKGTVISALETIFHTPSEIRNYRICACGPSPMLNAVKQFASDHSVECFVALETMMACGFGICQGCCVEKEQNSSTDSSYRKKYSLACIDGPVFQATEIKYC